MPHRPAKHLPTIHGADHVRNNIEADLSFKLARLEGRLATCEEKLKVVFDFDFNSLGQKLDLILQGQALLLGRHEEFPNFPVKFEAPVTWQPEVFDIYEAMADACVQTEVAPSASEDVTETQDDRADRLSARLVVPAFISDAATQTLACENQGVVVDPCEDLLFASASPQDPARSILKLSNRGKQLVAYRLKTTARESYSVQPPRGFIQPGEESEVNITLDGKADPAGDRFLLQFL